MQLLQCSAGVVEPALNAAAGLGRWFLGVAVFLNAVVFQLWRRCSATTAHRALPVCDEWPGLGMPWATARSEVEASAVCSRWADPALGAAAGLGRWFVGVAVLLNTGVFQLWRRCSAATAHIALPVCECPGLGIPWATAWSTLASAVCRSCGGACCTACCGRAGQVVCGFCCFADYLSCGGAARQPKRKEPCQCVTGQSWAYHRPLQGQIQPLEYAAGAVAPALGAAAGLGRWFCGCCSFAAFLNFSVEEVPLGNHTAQRPASVCVASPRHTMGHCNVKCGLCSVRQVWWSLRWVLRPGWAGGFVGSVVLQNAGFF